MLEYTIHADENDALYLSKQVQDFLMDEKTAEFVGLAMREILIYGVLDKTKCLERCLFFFWLNF